MKVRVKLFAVAKQRVGRDSVEVELPLAANVRQLRGALIEQVPQLAEVVPHARLALNNDYAADDTIVTGATEVAIIPPVSGG